MEKDNMTEETEQKEEIKSFDDLGQVNEYIV